VAEFKETAYPIALTAGGFVSGPIGLLSNAVSLGMAINEGDTVAATGALLGLKSADDLLGVLANGTSKAVSIERLGENLGDLNAPRICK